MGRDDLEFVPRYPCKKFGRIKSIYNPNTLVGVRIGWGGQKQTDPFDSWAISPLNQGTAGSVESWSHLIKWD